MTGSKRTTRMACCGLILAVSVAAPITVNAGEASFTPLPLVPNAPGNGGSLALSISAGGDYVVGNANSPTSTGNGETEAFRWTQAGGFEFLGDLPGGIQASFADRVSADGSVVVGRGRTGPSTLDQEAFRWTAETGMVGLGFLPGHTFSNAFGLTPDGSTVVGTSRNPLTGESFAYRWTESGGMQSLGGFVAGGASFGNGISADGETILGTVSTATSPRIAAKWTQADGWTTLGDLPGGSESSAAWASSADGSVIAGDSSSALAPAGEAFRWTEAGGMQGLGFLGGAGISTVSGMSADGSIIVGASTPPITDFTQAFIWDETHGMRNLREVLINDFGLDELLSWDLVGALGISDDGNTIAGWGRNLQDGFFSAPRGWIVTIPEPASLPLLVVGASVLLRRRRRLKLGI